MNEDDVHFSCKRKHDQRINSKQTINRPEVDRVNPKESLSTSYRWTTIGTLHCFAELQAQVPWD